MFINPVVLILENTETGKFHPIMFKEVPLPGPPSADKPARWKSMGHHTTGFETLEEAIHGEGGGVMETCKKLVGLAGVAYYDLDPRPWGGKDSPATSGVFDLSSLTTFTEGHSAQA